MAVADWIRIAILSLVWGGSFFFVEVMLEAMPPMTSVLGRLIVGLAGLVGLLKLLGHPLRPLMTQWRSFAWIGLINNAIPFSLISFGQTEITGSLASIINASTPIMTAVVAHQLTTDERLSLRKTLGIAFGFGGVLVLFGPAAMQGGASLLGMAAGLAATVCYAFGSVYSKRLKSNPPMLNATGQVLYGTLWMFPVVCLIDQPWSLPMPGIGPWLALMGIGLLSTTMAFFIYFRVLKTAGASNVVLVTFLVPVSASALGIVFLGEVLAIQHILAYLLIALGLAIIDGRIVARLAQMRLKSQL
ncbi:MAG TPA: EamA family transporter [Gammaproteobacteria bacterium]|nr:EamA family transporter [Gammaproteobacteria bacterium]